MAGMCDEELLSNVPLEFFDFDDERGHCRRFAIQDQRFQCVPPTVPVFSCWHVGSAIWLIGTPAPFILPHTII